MRQYSSNLQKYNLRLAAIGLLAAIFCVFWSSLENPFHYDDIHSIVENPHIRSLAEPLRFIVNPEMFSADPRQAMYRPVVVFSLALNYVLGAEAPFGYHLFNLILHAVNVLLVLTVAKHWGIGLRGAFFCAALFAFHPINVEVLNLISSRSEALCAAFFLSAFLCFSKYIKKADTFGWYWAALGLYVVALGAKSVAIMLPAVLLIYEVWLLDNKSIGVKRLVLRHGMFWLLSAVYLFIVRQFVMVAMVGQPVRSLTEQIWTQAKALIYYIKLIFIPYELSIEHQFHISGSLAEKAVVMALLFIISVGILFWCYRHKGRALSFWLIWSGLILMPTLLVPLNILVNEHRLYLPSMGFALGIGILVDQQKLSWLRWVSVGMILIMALMARQRTEIWQTSEQVWNDARQKAPFMPRPYIYQGDALHRAGQHEAALKAYEKARTINPASLSMMNQVTIYNNRGAALLAMGQTAAAMAAYRQALALDPEYDKARQSLAALTVLKEEQWEPKAEALYKQALRYLISAELEQAVSVLDKALNIQPQPEIYMALGLAYERQERPAAARQVYKELSARFPTSRLVPTAAKKRAALEGEK